MKIGLMGFVVSDANKGCEALTYSFLYLLKKCNLNAEKVIIHFFVQDADLEFIRKEFPEFEFSIGRIRLKDFNFKSIKEIRSCDVVFDVTCGDGFSDIYFPRQVFITTFFKILVELCRVKLILLPQTYGPFKNDKLKYLAKIAIKNSNAIYSRDETSTQYVLELSKRQCKSATDLAFALPFKHNEDKRLSSKISIGINVSGLLWNGGFTSDNQFSLTIDYKLYINELIKQLLKSKRYIIHIIPHVLESSEDYIDGDYHLSQQLAKQYNIQCAPYFQTPIEAKSYISDMDIFLGARMHSTIAAISSGVPVIPFSYSRKFEGLYEQLQYPFLIHGTSEKTDDAINKTMLWIENRSELKANIRNSMMIIKDLQDQFEKSFNDDLKQICEV